MFQNIYISFLYSLSLTILCETWTIKRQQIAKMNDQGDTGH